METRRATHPNPSPIAAQIPGSGEAVEFTVFFDSSRPGIGSAFYGELENEFVDRGLRVSHRFTVAESFGQSRRVRHDSTAELDPPMVVVAVDTTDATRSALGSGWSFTRDVIVTLSPTQIVRHAGQALPPLGSQSAEAHRSLPTRDRSDDPTGVGGVLQAMRRHGITGATALGRGEGTIAGQRHPPRLFSPSPDGPMMVVAIDDANVLALAAASLLEMTQVELITIKPICVCKCRECRRPPPTPAADQLAWSRITLYTAGERLFACRSRQRKLVGLLRELDAPASPCCAAPSATR